MWPTPVPSDDQGGWSGLDRRARVTVLLVVGALALSIVAATWLSLRGGQPSAPVYGGAAQAAATVWTWDGTTYTREPVAGAGPSSNDADMAFDAARRELVLWDHGCTGLVMGFTGGCLAQTDRTWTWDGRRWTAQATRTAPSEVGSGAMLYDAALRQVLYVNGAGAAWAWTGADWRPVAMAGGPRVARPDSAAAASTFAAGYDQRRGALVLVLSGATWTWAGGRWTELPGGIDAAEAGPDVHLVDDPATGQVVYVGARATWTWDGASWTSHPQPDLASGTAAYDPAVGAVVLVRQDASACDRTACRMATWTWDGAAWQPRPGATAPELPLTRSGAFPPPMAFDEARSALVLFASAS